MMEYKILEKTEDITITTKVEYVFEINGEKIIKEMDVPHFNPQSEADIIIGIENRFISEERALKEEQKKP